MSYVVLARKWRPKRFAEMVGQEHVLRALGNALDSGRVHHAFLFTGTRGVGKTTVARILAKSLNCERGVSASPCGICVACREIDEGRFVDLIEVDAASRTKVDDTRELLDNVQYAPTRGRYKVYLIDEVHMLSNHSFNALLKTLEEPPPHVKFLLATTDPQKLPVTVLSRCLQFSLKRLPAILIGERLKYIGAEERLEVEPAAVALLARAAEGSMRDALSLMDQLIAFAGGTVTESAARAMLGTLDRGHLARLLEALSGQDGPALLEHARAMDQDAPDYDRALADMAALLQRIAVIQVVPAAAVDEDEFDPSVLQHLSGLLQQEDVQLYYQIAIAARRDLAMAPEPRVGFEMALLRMLAFRPYSADAPRTAGATQPARMNAGAGETLKTSASEESVGGASAEREPSIDSGNWASVVDAAGLSGMVRQFALNCVPGEFSRGVLHLQIDRAAADRRSRQVEEKLAQCLSTHFNTPIRIVYEVSEGVLATPARRRTLLEQDRHAQAASAFEDDVLVKGLREKFGAEVDSTSVKPAG